MQKIPIFFGTGTTPVGTGTWDPSYQGTFYVLSGGNLISTGSVGNRGGLATPMFPAGALSYLEMAITWQTGVVAIPGIARISVNVNDYPGSSAQVATNSYGFQNFNGQLYIGGVGNAAYGTPWTGANHVIGIAFNAVTGSLFFSVDNVWQNSGNPATNTNPAVTGLTGDWYPCWGAHSANVASFSTTGHFTSGSLVYTPPAGFSPIY